MNGFIKKSVGTMTLAEKLRKLRSERRLSLHEASRQTKIRSKYLEYLEDGNYDRLPAEVYVKGFLKSYADFLGVNENILIRQYDKEMGILNNLKKENGSEVKMKNPIRTNSFVITPRMIIFTAVCLLVGGGFFYLYKEVGSFASAPRLVILSPEDNYSTSGNSVSVEGVTDKDAQVFINGQPVLVNDDGRFHENLTLQSGTNPVNIKAVNRFDKEAESDLTLISTHQEENVQENASSENSSAAETEKIELEVRVDPGPVWLSVESDGNLVFSGTMLTGAQQKFEATEKIFINSGKADATFIKFNGKDVGALGESGGAVRGVTFTKDTKF